MQDELALIPYTKDYVLTLLSITTEWESTLHTVLMSVGGLN